jgi:subtilase family serine protease
MLLPLGFLPDRSSIFQQALPEDASSDAGTGDSLPADPAPAAPAGPGNALFASAPLLIPGTGADGTSASGNALPLAISRIPEADLGLLASQPIPGARPAAVPDPVRTVGLSTQLFSAPAGADVPAPAPTDNAPPVADTSSDSGPVVEPMLILQPMGGPGPGGGYSPSMIRHAYGFDALPSNDDGTGQTIAIVDAYNAPNIFKDVPSFNSLFGLQQFNVSGGPTLTRVNQSGGSSLPWTSSGWALEISMDVEWAHAIAPKANILLVEANSASFSNLMKAVSYAAGHAKVVSMSWGGSEFSGETSYDSYFNKSGVTFLVSSGDSGTGVSYPAVSPYVVGVGGTTLPLDNNGNLTGSETAWNGSGGGLSVLESKPGYQSSFPIPSLAGSKRGSPDVAYNADPNSGFSVYDSTPYYGQSGWWIVGGTSAGAPQWAGLVALVNQHRSAGSLSSNSLTSSPLYNAAGSSVYASNYRDITSGSNGSGILTTATTGYDFVTGLGSPRANNLVPYLQTH